MNLDDYAREKANTGFEQWWKANALKLPVADDYNLARLAYEAGCTDQKRGDVAAVRLLFGSMVIGKLEEFMKASPISSSTPQGEESK